MRLACVSQARAEQQQRLLQRLRLEPARVRIKLGHGTVCLLHCKQQSHDSAIAWFAKSIRIDALQCGIAHEGLCKVSDHDQEA
jgi:hypothetical protein